MRAVTIDSDLATLFTFTPRKPPITPIQCVSRALRGGSGKEEPLPKSTTLGAPPLPPRALQAAPGNDGLPPTQPPLGTPRQPMCDGSNPLSHPASGMARHSNPQAGVRTASGSHS